MDQKIWDDICEHLAFRVGRADFDNWIKPLAFKTIKNDILNLESPNPFIKNWIEKNLTPDILISAKEHFPQIQGIVIHLKKGEEEDQSLESKFTFKNFVVGKSNEFAYAAARRVAESKQVMFNPLFLYGGVGLGKTHLMHAIAWHIKSIDPQRKILYLSAEKFMYKFIKAIRFKDTVSFKEEFRNVDVLMIDDVQFFGAANATQEEFFHTFNALVDNNRQIIISADKSPSDLNNIEERLRSRLGWGLVADIHPTTYELRLGILQNKVELMKADVCPKILELLAFKITSNVRELEGALNRIIAHSTLIGRSINEIDEVQYILKDVLRANDRQITIDDIKKKVSEFFGIKFSDLSSATRLSRISKARQVAMYFCRTLTAKSFPEIGREFGGRDHTSVMYSTDKVQVLLEKDLQFAKDLSVLKICLQNSN